MLRSLLFEENQGVPNQGAPPPAPPPFDPEAFFLRFEQSLDKRVNAIDKRLKTLEKPPAPVLHTEPPPTPAADPLPPNGNTPGNDPHINALRLEFGQVTKALKDQLEAEKKKREDADRKSEETDRHSLIRSKLAKMPIREDAFEDAFGVFTNLVKRSDDGSLVAGDLPFEQFIETQLNGPKAYFLKNKDVNGSGAGRPGYSGGAKPIDISSIHAASTAEEQKAYAAQINAVLPKYSRTV